MYNYSPMSSEQGKIRIVGLCNDKEMYFDIWVSKLREQALDLIFLHVSVCYTVFRENRTIAVMFMFQSGDGGR